MRHLIKTILFLGVGLALFLFIESRFEVSSVGQRVYKVVGLSKKLHDCSKIVIGDSVGRQLFGVLKQGKTLHLTSNQAISMVGQYILIANYIKVNPGKLKNIVFVIHPWMFQNNLDQKFTFNYFFLPFFSSEYDDYFSPLVLAHIKKYKYYFIARLPWIKVFIRKHLEYFPVDYSKLIEMPFSFQGPYLSPITIQYLKKLQSLCMEHNICFRLVSPPIKKKYVSDFTFMKIQIRENSLEEMFTGYFANLVVLDEPAFKDNVHLKYPYLKRNRASILKKMKMPGRELMNEPPARNPRLKYFVPMVDPFLKIKDREPDFIDHFKPRAKQISHISAHQINTVFPFLRQSQLKGDFDISISPLKHRLNVFKVTLSGAAQPPHTDRAKKNLASIYLSYNLGRIKDMALNLKPGDRVYFSVLMKGHFAYNPRNIVYLSLKGNASRRIPFFESSKWYEYRVYLQVKGSGSYADLEAGIRYTASNKNHTLEIKEPKIYILPMDDKNSHAPRSLW